MKYVDTGEKLRSIEAISVRLVVSTLEVTEHKKRRCWGLHSTAKSQATI